MGVTAVEGNDEAEILLRNSQLSKKAEKKAKGKKGEKRGTGKRKAKKSRKARKSKKVSSKNKKAASPVESSDPFCLSPSKRKIKTLKKSKSAKCLEEEPVAPVVKSSRRRKANVRECHGPTGQSVGAEVDKKPRGRAARKTEKNTNLEGTGRKGSHKMPTAKAKAKASAKSRARSSSSRANKKAKTKHDELFDEEVMTQLMEFSARFNKDADFKTDVFKTFMRSQVTLPEGFSLNLYWTSASCGVKDKEAKRDIHSFTFNSIPAPHVWRLAVAVKCAEIAAAQRLINGKKRSFAYGLERKDPNYEKRGAGISYLKYTAAYTLGELAAKLPGTQGVDVN
eukprot:s217_g16.t1